jgi:hypothetical protein
MQTFHSSVLVTPERGENVSHGAHGLGLESSVLVPDFLCFRKLMLDLIWYHLNQHRKELEAGKQHPRNKSNVCAHLSVWLLANTAYTTIILHLYYEVSHTDPVDISDLLRCIMPLQPVLEKKLSTIWLNTSVNGQRIQIGS